MASVQYNDEGDALVWQYDSKGIYTSRGAPCVYSFSLENPDPSPGPSLSLAVIA